MSGPSARAASWEEQATWGECPTCHAKQGEWCNPAVGFSLGQSVSGGPPVDGVHLARLQAAPHFVQLVRA